MSDQRSATRRHWSLVRPMPAPMLTEIAKLCEASGFEGLFAPQVYGPPFLPLATAAAVTERMKLASGIARTRSHFAQFLSTITILPGS